MTTLQKALLTISISVAVGMGIYEARPATIPNPPEIRRFLELRDKWDRTAVGQAQEEFAERCLELGGKRPDTMDELAGLYLAACRAPKTAPGQKARDLFIALIAKADLSQLAQAIGYSHSTPMFNNAEALPDQPAVMHYYHVYSDQRITRALLDRLKRSLNDSHTAGLLTLVCVMSKGDDNEEPTAQFAQAADLIASQYADSPDIRNFCEMLGFLAGSPSWAGNYERHLRTILKANQARAVQCAGQFALASVVETTGGSRQAEAEEMYQQFLEKFDGQHTYHYQGIEKNLREQAEKRLEGMRFCGIGQPAPEVVGVDLDGKPMKLSEYRGKVVLLSFWATWCSPCMNMIPHERAIAMRLQDKPFTIVGVNGDTAEAAIQKAVTTYEITWRSFRNGRPGKIAIFEEWKNIGWPTLYLIDQKGVIREKWLDAPPLDKLDRAIDQLLGTKP